MVIRIYLLISTYRPSSVSGIPRKRMVDSPRKVYLKTLVRHPQIPKCPNGYMHCEDISMGASRGEDIGRYYYYVSNISNTTDVFTYISSSAKRCLEKSLASTSIQKPAGGGPLWCFDTIHVSPTSLAWKSELEVDIYGVSTLLSPPPPPRMQMRVAFMELRCCSHILHLPRMQSKPEVVSMLLEWAPPSRARALIMDR